MDVPSRTALLHSIPACTQHGMIALDPTISTHTSTRTTSDREGYELSGRKPSRQAALQAGGLTGRQPCRQAVLQAVSQAGSFAGRQPCRQAALQAGGLAGRVAGRQPCGQAVLQAVLQPGSLAGGVTGSASGRQSCRQTSLHATGIDAFSELLNRKESEVENMRLKKMYLADSWSETNDALYNYIINEVHGLHGRGPRRTVAARDVPGRRPHAHREEAALAGAAEMDQAAAEPAGGGRRRRRRTTTHNNKMIMLEPESSEVFESLGGL